MGYAAQHSSGQLRLGVSATVTSAVLYSAVVLFGLGSASPSAQGRATHRSSPVVRVAPDRAVSGPGKRLPQVSPGPARRNAHPRVRSRGSAPVVTATVPPVTAPDSEQGAPTRPAAPQPKPKTAASATSETQPAPHTGSTPSEPDPIIAVPELPVTVPDLPVTVPTVPVPLPPPPSVQAPALPGPSLP
jgi:hypothetical protein